MDAPKPSKKDTCVGGDISFFVFALSVDGPETTIKIVFAEQHQKNAPKTPNSSNFTKTPDVAFPNILGFFAGHDARP